METVKQANETYYHGKIKDLPEEKKALIEEIYYGYRQHQIPKEYWEKYFDNVIYETEHNLRFIELKKCVIPCVIVMHKLKKGKYEGEILNYGEKQFYTNISFSHINYERTCFLGNDGQPTRNVKEAKVIYVLFEHFQFELNGYVETFLKMNFDMPNNYVYYTVFPVWEAQEKLDKDYPEPRKAISKNIREEVYKKFNGHCAYCGCELELEDMQVDHIASHMGGCGKDEIDNYYPACEVCNRVKTNRTLEDFKKSIRHCGEIHRKRKTPIMADSDKIAYKYGLHECDKEVEFYFEKLERTK